MSTLTRMALLAAGAVAGAAATRWASSETGRRTLSELGITSGPNRAELTGSTPAQDNGVNSRALRENKLASRVLRVAQDVRVATAQREGELRSQLGLPAPEQVRARRALDGTGGNNNITAQPEHG